MKKDQFGHVTKLKKDQARLEFITLVRIQSEHYVAEASRSAQHQQEGA